MKLYVNLSDRTITASPRTLAPIQRISARRGETVTIDVCFSIHGRTGPLPAGSSIVLAAYNNPVSRTPLVLAGAYDSVIGRGTSTTYRFNAVSFGSAGLQALLGTQKQVVLNFEVRVGYEYAQVVTHPVQLVITQAAQVT